MTCSPVEEQLVDWRRGVGLQGHSKTPFRKSQLVVLTGTCHFLRRVSRHGSLCSVNDGVGAK